MRDGPRLKWRTSSLPNPTAREHSRKGMGYGVGDSILFVDVALVYKPIEVGVMKLALLLLVHRTHVRMEMLRAYSGVNQVEHRSVHCVWR